MNELKNTNAGATSRNACLLATSSLLVLGLLTAKANAESSSTPTVWIELGGQLEHLNGGGPRIQTVFDPALSEAGLLTPTSVQQSPHYSYGGELKVDVQPHGTKWSFEASVRYGRSNGAKHRYEQTSSPIPYIGREGYYNLPSQLLTSDAQAKFAESHSILDFEAQRDVGLGLSQSNVKIGFGVRMAQFSSKESMKAYAFPHHSITIPTFLPLPHEHYVRYVASAEMTQNFHGVGPAITLSGRTPIGTISDGNEVIFDWGMNGSLLFGRQKRGGVQRTHEKIVTFLPLRGKYLTSQITHDLDRTRSVVVPNVGGTAAVTLDFSTARITLGYRADFFFGATGAGLNSSKTYDRNFYGPFATISIGLGG
jgi:hypothetical protein